mmetsp:Transcript_3516/g.9888  ORF Transcript_3516/g.9888 Transcript_3516/m.9888 type:complete len:223 (-) Transcript_3516:955-1623(-)
MAAEILSFSPMYSLLVPLKGILVLTMLTKTPIPCSKPILYLFHFSWLAVLVMTSLPCSNSKGILFANLNTFNWFASMAGSLPPMLTAASTMKAWPSKAYAVPWWVATMSGLSSFMTPSLKLYSPAGDRSLPSGSANLTCCMKLCSFRSWLSFICLGAMSSLSSVTILFAMVDVMLLKSPLRNFESFLFVLPAIFFFSSSRSTSEGWCLASRGGSGILSVLRV